ncbi:MAG: hypothetical protein MJ250_05655 [Alphaproteobacteria bacterium]|nr:hypothetical protein [Alphaproteobacteria bacterium]
MMNEVIIPPLSGKKPKQLIVYFHGMGGTAATNAWFGEALHNVLPDAVVCIANGFVALDGNEDTRGWFPVPANFNDNWFTVHPSQLSDEERSKFFEMYDMYHPYAQTTADYVKEKQKQFHLSASHTYVMGVSQGAMLLAQLVAESDLLADKNEDGSLTPIGGAVIVCGCLLNVQKVEEHPAQSKPEIIFIHGSEDHCVPFDAMLFSDRTLLNLGQKTIMKIVWGKDHTYFEREALDEILRITKKLVS